MNTAAVHWDLGRVSDVEGMLYPGLWTNSSGGGGTRGVVGGPGLGLVPYVRMGERQGSTRMAVHHRRREDTPLWIPLPQTKVTIVGKNEIYHSENLVGPNLVHNFWGPRPPPPLLILPWRELQFFFGTAGPTETGRLKNSFAGEGGGSWVPPKMGGWVGCCGKGAVMTEQYQW